MSVTRARKKGFGLFYSSVTVASQDAVAQVFELFDHLARRAVELGGDALLHLDGQRAELLAQVAVGRVLRGRRRGAGAVSSVGDRGRFGLGARRVGGPSAHLDGEEGGAEEDVVAPAQRRRLLPQVHLEVL